MNSAEPKSMVIKSIITVGGKFCSELVIQNDRIGTKEFGNYDVKIYQPHGLICEFRIENWHRGIGLEALVAYALNLFVHASDSNSGPGIDFVFGGEAPKSLTMIENVKLARVVKFESLASAPAGQVDPAGHTDDPRRVGPGAGAEAAAK